MNTISEIVKNLDARDRLLYLVFIIFSVLFLLLQFFFNKYPGSFIIKVIPILSLSILIIKNVRGIQGKLVLTGLLFSAAGDITLEIDRVNYFIPGLIFFLTAHIFYIIAFIRKFKFSRKRLPAAVTILIYSGILAYILRDIRKDRIIPVMFYLLVISVMALTALFVSTGNLIILMGALIFMISDTIIAVNQFLNPIPHSTLYNISLYYIAQLMITTGFIGESK
ncbi:lysoplasmalogenase [Spirochaetota bacterium]